MKWGVGLYKAIHRVFSASSFFVFNGRAQRLYVCRLPIRFSRDEKGKQVFTTLRSPSSFAIFLETDGVCLIFLLLFPLRASLNPSFFLLLYTEISFTPSYSTLFIFSKTQAGIIFCFGSEFNFFFVALTNIVSCVMYARRLCRTVCYSASMLDMYFLLKELFRKVGQGK